MNRYEYISFDEKDVPGRKTKVWECSNNKSNVVLGIVKWHPQWRQYCYFPTAQAVYSAGCLKDIADFIQKAMADRQINKAQR